MRLQQNSGIGIKSLPPSTYQTPDAVLKDPDLAAEEKREILADWSSDRHAAPRTPWLRDVLGVVEPIPVAEILYALRKLDDDDPPPRGGVSMRAHQLRFNNATPAAAANSRRRSARIAQIGPCTNRDKRDRPNAVFRIRRIGTWQQ
jgi:hypothetical protein